MLPSYFCDSGLIYVQNWKTQIDLNYPFDLYSLQFPISNTPSKAYAKEIKYK